MLTKRIIPCLDIKNGRVVKGKQFKDIIDVDSPEILAKLYNDSGADELVFYDVTASYEDRKTYLDFIKIVAEYINIPFCVGGGVSSLYDFSNILRQGANKVSINSSAVKNPGLIKQASLNFGSQSVVLSIDAKKSCEGSWSVYIKGGREKTNLDVIEWAKKGADLGAGEIVVSSIDEDGMKNGYDIELLSKITEVVDVPVIASRGAGSMDDFCKVIKEANVDGVLAASVFHFGEINIKELKDYMIWNGISIRI